MIGKLKKHVMLYCNLKKERQINQEIDLAESATNCGKIVIPMMRN